jgi:hypothetical protein
MIIYFHRFFVVGTTFATEVVAAAFATVVVASVFATVVTEGTAEIILLV